jgi:hypothetical protein
MSIFDWKIFPVCFVESAGLTSFKIVSEYIIALILFVSMAYVDKNIRTLEITGKGNHFEELLNQVQSSEFGAKGLI